MIEILKAWVAGEEPQRDQLQQLEELELRDGGRAAAFGVTADNVQDVVKKRSQLYQAILQQNINLPPLPTRLELLWNLWLPLATQLVQLRQTLGRPPVQGILGGQGTGKTTLAIALTTILDFLGYRTLSLSIDDLYKSYAEREYLREQDPRLIWRGPPGTHDVAVGLEVLQKLRQPQQEEAIAIPRFDKSLWNGAGDRIEPQTVSDIDIVLFEGWFVGCRPVEESQFEYAPEPIVTAEDRQYACDINYQLQEYVPLWNCLDQLMVLNPVDYRLSKQWRKQAEQEMIATGKSGMSDAEIEQFVDYFWKSLHPELFIVPLITNPDLANLVVEINADHSVGIIYQPGQ